MERGMAHPDTQHAVAGFMADWRAEVVAACLNTQGYDREHILIKRLGSNNRNVSREIERIGIIRPTSLPDQQYIEIEVNRASLYDALPESLFHDSRYSTSDKTKDQIIEEIRTHGKEEYFIRHFMRLFEAEIDQNRLEIFLSELHFDQQDSYRDFARIFEPYWNILQELPLRQVNLFMKCLPSFHAIRRDYARIGDTMGAILETPVSVCVRYAGRDIDDTPRMQDMHMDRDFVLPGRQEDGLPDFKVTVGDIAASRVRDFLPGASMRRALEQLCSMLLPAASGVEIRITVVQDECALHLSGAGERYPCYLGINSYLIENHYESEKQ